MSLYKSITEKDTLNNLEHTENYVFKQDLILYKGIASDLPLSSFYEFNSPLEKRESKTAIENGNVYNLLLNNLPSWGFLPKREKSIIVTSNLNTAKAFATPLLRKNQKYGCVYCVIPPINGIISIAPEKDIWYSCNQALNDFNIRTFRYSLIDFNRFIDELFFAVNIQPPYDVVFDQFISYLEKIAREEILPQTELSIEAKNVLTTIKAHKNNIISFVDMAFEPKRNGFSLKPYNAELKSKDYFNNEIWTDESCLLVEHSIFEQYRNKNKKPV